MRLPRLPGALVPIYGTTLADVLGYTLMIPLLPDLAAQYHASYFTAGSLISVPAFCSMFSSPFWGRVSDRIGRKSIILISLGVTLVGYVMMALANALIWIFIARIISGLGAGNISAAQSYIADVTNERQRDEAYALYGVIFGFAFIIGPVASAFLMRHGVQFPFYVAALLEAFNIAFAAALLPAKVGRHEGGVEISKIVHAALQPKIESVLMRQFLFIFGVVFFLGGFALYLRAALDVGISRVAGLLAGAGIAGAIVQVVLVSPLARRFGEPFTARIGFIALLVAYGFLYWVRNFFAFVLVLGVWAIGAAMVEPSIMALLSLRIPARQRGALMGVGDSLNSIALIIAPAASGAIIGADARFIGVLPAVVTIVALVLPRPKVSTRH
jgi:DHA1 family tetracycline resistance protein-like MFS transporter